MHHLFSSARQVFPFYPLESGTRLCPLSSLSLHALSLPYRIVRPPRDCQYVAKWFPLAFFFLVLVPIHLANHPSIASGSASLHHSRPFPSLPSHMLASRRIPQYIQHKGCVFSFAGVLWVNSPLFRFISCCWSSSLISPQEKQKQNPAQGRSALSENNSNGYSWGWLLQSLPCHKARRGAPYTPAYAFSFSHLTSHLVFFPSHFPTHSLSF